MLNDQANQGTLKGLSDDREAMKQSIRGLRANIEQLAVERGHAEKEALERRSRWQERMEELKLQGQQVRRNSRPTRKETKNRPGVTCCVVLCRVASFCQALHSVT